jgi:diguanylate cyclase (GGDEF)-like protein/PAS domain S-box-containing protein
MHRRVTATACLLARTAAAALRHVPALLLVAWMAPCHAAQTPVTLAVLAFRPQPETLARWQPTADYLAHQTGRPFRLEALTYTELEAAIAQRRVDFVLTNPSHYVVMTRRNGLSSPLATLIELDNGLSLTQFGGVIFTRAGTAAIDELADLEGRTVATPDTGSLGGYQMQAHELLRIGLDPAGDIDLLVTGMPHDKAIYAVLEGRADAGFVRTGVIEALALAGRLDATRLRVLDRRQSPGFPFLHSTRLYPEWPFAAMPQVEHGLAQAVAKALFSITEDDPPARLGHYHGWAIPADYEPIRALLQELRLPPYDTAPPFTLADVLARHGLAIGLAGAGAATIVALLVLLAVRNRQLNRQDQRLAESELRFRQFADNSNVVFWVRTEREMLYISKAYEAIWGRDRAGLYADPDSFVDAVHPDDRARVAAAFLRNQADGAGFDEEYRVVRPDGGMSWVHARSFPVRDEAGQVIRWTGVAEDVTARRTAERLVRQQAEERQQLLAGLADGVYGVDRDGRCTFANPAALAMLGYREDELLGRDQHALIHHHRPDGADYRHTDCPIHLTLQDGRVRRLEEWFFRKDGSGFPVEMAVNPMAGEGQRTGVVVVFRDIGDRLAARARDQLLVSALEAVANAIVITDPEARIEWVNPAFESLTGYGRAEAIGRRPAELVKSGLQDSAFYEDMWQTIRAGRTWRGEVVNKKRDGSLYHEELIIAPVLDDGGGIRHYVGIKQDISERKRLEAELHSLATTDPLTGLPNRRHFLTRLEQEVARLQRYDGPGAALLMLDLDHFKAINDSHGHAAGDTVLKRFAGQVGASLRRTDQAGRLGGEEFAILLLGNDLAGAVDFAERLRERVAAEAIAIDGVRVRVTVSIGVTLLDASDGSGDAALARADAALYRAKANGRDRVETA